MKFNQILNRTLVLTAVVLLAGCSTSYGLRSSTGSYGGFSGFTEKKTKPPVEYKSEEGIPYTARLTYGEICVNSKRFGREFCFPCYPVAQGGCDAAVGDLIDKAIATSGTIGPSYPTLPTFQQSPQASFTPYTPQIQQAPLASYPNVYPNFSR